MDNIIPKMSEYPVLANPKNKGVLICIKVFTTEVNPIVAPNPKMKLISFISFLTA